MDELILIQSVFSNSNFTNNVIGGNLQEVITEVSNIDETVIVKLIYLVMLLNQHFQKLGY